MIFSNPQLWISLSKGWDDQPVMLYKVLQESKNKLTEFGYDLTPRNQIGAPFVTAAEIEICAGNLAMASITMELPTSAIQQMREIIFLEHEEAAKAEDQASAKYSRMHIQFGYGADVRSASYGFLLVQNADVSIGDSVSSITFKLCAGTPMTSEPLKFLPTVTVKELIEAVYKGATLSIGGEEAALSAKIFSKVKDPIFTRGPKNAWLKQVFDLASIIMSVSRPDRKLQITVTNVKEKANVNIPGDYIKHVDFVPKEYMQSKFAGFNKEAEKLIMPIMEWTLEDPLTLLSKTSTQALNINSQNKDKDAKEDKKLNEAVVPKNVALSAETGSQITPLNKDNYGRVGQFITVKTMLWPKIVPLFTTAIIKTPLGGLAKAELRIMSVKYQPLDGTMIIKCFIVGDAS